VCAGCVIDNWERETQLLGTAGSIDDNSIKCQSRHGRLSWALEYIYIYIQQGQHKNISNIPIYNWMRWRYGHRNNIVSILYIDISFRRVYYIYDMGAGIVIEKIKKISALFLLCAAAGYYSSSSSSTEGKRRGKTKGREVENHNQHPGRKRREGRPNRAE
jgi:hypothetical protein